MVMGIYKIINRNNNKIYIGSSEDIVGRWKEHVNQLETNTHHSWKLQNDYNKYGFTVFDFSIIEIIKNPKYLLEIEQGYIDKYSSYDDNIGYNVRCSTTGKVNDKDFTKELELLYYYKNINNEDKIKLKNNLNIFSGENEKIISRYKDKYCLSKTWYRKEGAQQICKDAYNYCKKKNKSLLKELYFTVFIMYLKEITNDKRLLTLTQFAAIDDIPEQKRNCLCFLINCYCNSFNKLNMERSHNIKINDDEWALSLILRWITNCSDINKRIDIYIPSYRMRTILTNWINSI